MPKIIWDSDSNILVVAADRSLSSVLHRLDTEDPDWVVLVRTLADSPEVFYYAYRSEELRQVAQRSPDRLDWPVEDLMGLHEYMSSSTARGGRRLTGPEPRWMGKPAARVVDFNAAGHITAIGQLVEEDKPAGLEAVPPSRGISTEKSPPAEGGGGGRPSSTGDLSFDLGSMRGGVGSERPSRGSFGSSPLDLGPSRGLDQSEPEPAKSAKPADEIEVMLSAETKAEIRVEGLEKVKFRLELAAEAVPLAVTLSAAVRPDEPIKVSLSVENDALVIDEEAEKTVTPPAHQKPVQGYFLVRGVRAGVVRLAVSFRQGGSELGVIGLAVEVVVDAARATPAQGSVIGASRDVADDDTLTLLVELRQEGGQVYYEYRIEESEGLKLPYMRLRSKPLLDRGDGPAATNLAFVERIYDRVTQELKTRGDLEEIQREANAVGNMLCKELFDPDVARKLWPLRSRIKVVEIVSWEPYIPWELVRLRDPDSGKIDDRFLAEYGLVRKLNDHMPSRSLPMSKWVYLGATFPPGTLKSVGAELNYFTDSSPESLRGHGITPEPLPATRNAFYEAMAGGNFDVLHISCHGQSHHQSIDQAKLIIGYENQPGSSQGRLVEVDTAKVEVEASLQQRRPLVFLNACETGRMGAVLTEWGGWPTVFLRQGAGAFVGTSWSVYDNPAATFATTFYNTMLAGKTLVEAANAARNEAKVWGDVSWLAFKVYGHPQARRV